MKQKLSHLCLEQRLRYSIFRAGGAHLRWAFARVSIWVGVWRETRAVECLRNWQEKVLSAVQSMQIDSAAVLLPLLLVEDAAGADALSSTPFSEQQQKDCRLDGELEGDVRDPSKRRPLAPVQEPFVDHHVQQYLSTLPEGQEPKSKFLIPRTGAQCSRMPKYRELKPMTPTIPATAAERSHEARLYSAAYAEDYRQNISAGQMRMHKATCFKYVVEKGVKKAKHCRFHFCNFVSLALRVMENGVNRIRNFVFARTGKDLVLPRQPGQPMPCSAPVDENGDPIPLHPTAKVGATVNVDDAHGRGGCVMPTRWNPNERSSNGPAQVSVRANTDFQSMRKTFKDGFTEGRDEIRDPAYTEADLDELHRQGDKAFAGQLQEAVENLAKERQAKGLEYKCAEALAEDLWRDHLARQKRPYAGTRIGDRILPRAVRRFKNLIRSLVVSMVGDGIAAAFYACGYSTKPNMTCAPLLVAYGDG